MATSSLGSQMRRWSTSLSAWQYLGGVADITGPKLSRNTFSASYLDIQDGYHRFGGGLRTSTLEFTVHFSRDVYDEVKSDFDRNSAKRYAVLLSDEEDTLIGFEGVIEKIHLKIFNSEVVVAEISMTISGAITVVTWMGVVWKDLGVTWMDTDGTAWKDATHEDDAGPLE